MTKQFKISANLFATITANTRMKGRALDAAKLHLVNGMGVEKAAELAGITREAVYKCVRGIKNKAFNMGACPCCGQAVQVDK